MHSLIVGCGDTGVRVAARAVAAGDTVTGVVRSAQSAARVRAVGAHALVLDLDHDTLDLPACDRLFYFAPPQREGETDTRMRRVLSAMTGAPRFAVYISTSGVYGDCAGEWVDEDRPVNAESDRAKRRVDAEQQMLEFCSHACVLRAPGIYGPNRLPVQRVLDGTPILNDADGGFSNRIHIDDLAAIAWRVGTRVMPHRVYNASDGHPTGLGIYYDTLSHMLDVESPPRISWAEAEQRFSAMRLSFLRESRRLRNQRLLTDSGYVFSFADFRDGLAASLRAQAPLD
ncbi:NAD-dependent epimerase/dehydratase [Salinisphaera dokdonensis CL-ES53]|uniref:NAD-dependent epimerase/dehydratase n=1 Tax=Salinisphaera dokdonensis CL-ES53 TaxID=1304272 RepID=A0ABV2B2X5_9GAMM